MAGLLLILDFYTEYSNRDGETVNTYLLPGISLLASSEATLVDRGLDITLYSSTLKMFSEIANLIQIQKVAPIIGW